ncbi:hypothetical protein L873DRAFT_1822922, partial [Choiromyces venosus 120613-1]
LTYEIKRIIHPLLYPNYIFKHTVISQDTPVGEIPTPGTNSPLSTTPIHAQTNNPRNT